MGTRHVLIGGGPATVAAAAAIRAVDAAAEITVIAADRHGYYSRPGLAYLLTGEIPEKSLYPFSAEDLGALRAEWITARAAGIDRETRSVLLEDGRTVRYDRLLLATGSRAIKAKVPGRDLDGVVTLDDLRDARDIIRRCRKGGTALVVGGGITALEIVEGMRARGVTVHYLLRKERYWGSVLSQTESDLVESRLESEGVRVHRNAELAAIIGRDGRVAGAETESGEHIPCEVVGVAVGVLPAVELALAAGLTCAQGVLVDEHLRTSDAHIYAAGDIAEAIDTATGKRVMEVLWNAAVAKGRVAGLNMATSAGHIYEEGVPLNITRLGGMRTTIIGSVGTGRDTDLQGISRGDSQVWSEPSEGGMVEAHAGDAHVRLALGRRVIAGAVVMGEQALSFPLQELVEARVDAGHVVGALRESGDRMEELVTGLWEDWRAGGV